MKYNRIYAGAILAAAGLIGWLAVTSSPEEDPAPPARPGRATSQRTRLSPAEPSAPGLRTRRSDRSNAGPQGDRGDGGGIRVMGSDEKGRTEAAKLLFGHLNEGLVRHLGRISERLDLTDAQLASLQSWLDEQTRALEAQDFFNDQQAMEELAGNLTPKALEDHLLSSLTPAQKSALKEFRGKESRLKADTAALKNLSKIQNAIDLEDGQRDEVYRIFSEIADADLKATGGPNSAALYYESLGLDWDPHGLGLEKLLPEAIEGSGEGGVAYDGQEVRRRMLAAFDKHVEDRIELLRPVLNESQLGRYRQELKAHGLGMFRSLGAR